MIWYIDSDSMSTWVVLTVTSVYFHVKIRKDDLCFVESIGVPEVDPEDVFLISILLEDGLEALLETIDRGLACAENGEARKLVKGLLGKRLDTKY